MKTLLKTAGSLALSLSTLGFAPEASAVDLNLFLNVFDKGGDWYTVKGSSSINSKFSDFNSAYFGNAGRLVPNGNGMETWYLVSLPGSLRDSGAFILKLKKPNSSEELVFKSKEEAEGFCGELAQLGADVHKTTGVTINPSDALFTSQFGNGFTKSVITIPYEIAYGNESVLSPDGKTSTKGRKHLNCQNQAVVEIRARDMLDDEKESTGIREVNFRESKYYDVTCMDGKIPKTTYELKTTVSGYTLWSNDRLNSVVVSNSPTEHQLNESLGAKYCPMS